MNRYPVFSAYLMQVVLNSSNDLGSFYWTFPSNCRLGSIPIGNLNLITRIKVNLETRTRI